MNLAFSLKQHGIYLIVCHVVSFMVEHE